LCLLGDNGADVTPRGAKTQGLLALIGSAPGLRRTRAFLQDKLWSDRGPEQGAASLRQSLAEIRRALGDGRDCLVTEAGMVGLDPDRVRVVVEPGPGDWGPTGEASEFVEGLDVADPEFENWIRDQRLAFADRLEARPTLGTEPTRGHMTVQSASGIETLSASASDNARLPPRLRLRPSGNFATVLQTVRGGGFRQISDIEIERAARRRRVTVAVLRPDVFSDDPRWRRYADALADNLTTDLAGFGDIAVTARRSAYSVDSAAELTAVAGTLGADYLIESSIAVEADRIRAQFQLIDGRTAAHACARRLDRPIADAAQSCDEMAATVANWVGGWGGAILRAEHGRLGSDEVGLRGAYDHYVLASAAERIREPEHVAIARRHIERSLELDPDNARALLLLFIILRRPSDLFGEVTPDTDVKRANEALARAYVVDPHDPLVLAEVCLYRAREGDIGGAITALDRAAEIGARQAEAVAVCASLYAMVAGDMKEARHLLDRAHQLNPTPKEWCRFTVARVGYFSGNFAASAEAAGPQPKLLPLAVFGTLALAMQGKSQDAARALRALEARFPRSGFEDYAARFPIVAPNARALYDEGVRRLGSHKLAARPLA
jgi:TolB-like protein/tetratricopeptide (TPR) repeat protein